MGAMRKSHAAYAKRCLREGLDELGYTLTQLDRIKAFERGYAH
jgi:3-isopropylmalate/(R)-2-methylmalate dehydratase small subunit